MGQLFVSLLEKDHIVSVADVNDWERMPELLEGVHIVIVAVTMAHTNKVIELIAPMLKREQGLSDITSIKGPVMDKMMALHKGPVLGMHPIFGPGITEFNHPFILTQGRERHFFEPITQSFVSLGFDCEWMSAAEHDRLMNIIQGLNYHCLRLFIEKAAEIEMANCPIKEVIDSFRAEDQGLYDSILTATAERVQFIGQFDVHLRLTNEQSESQTLFDALSTAEINFALRYVDWETLWRFASPNYRAKLTVIRKLVYNNQSENQKRTQ